jgi:hypothetical protein
MILVFNNDVLTAEIVRENIIGRSSRMAVIKNVGETGILNTHSSY